MTSKCYCVNNPRQRMDSAIQCPTTLNCRAQWLSAWLETEGLWVWASPASLCCGPWVRRIYPSLVLVQPRKTHPYKTERLLMGRKESNQTNKIIADAKTVPTYMYMLYVKLSCVFYLNQSMKYSDCVLWSIIPITPKYLVYSEFVICNPGQNIGLILWCFLIAQSTWNSGWNIFNSQKHVICSFVVITLNSH